MKVADNFLAEKLDVLQMIMAIQDPDKLKKVRAVLEDQEPTPQHLLDLIKRRQAEGATDKGTPLEEYLEELEVL